MSLRVRGRTQNSNLSRNLTWCRSKFARSTAPGALVVPLQIWGVPRCRHEGVPAKSRVEGWADVERLPCEDIQRGPAVVAQVAHLPSKPRAGHDLRCKSGPCAREGFVLDAVGWKQVCPIVRKQEVDRADQLVTFELAVGEQLYFGTVVIGSHAARFVHETPMRRHAQGQAERACAR